MRPLFPNQTAQFVPTVLIPRVVMDPEFYNHMIQDSISKTNELYLTRQQNVELNSAYQNAILLLQSEINARTFDINRRREDKSYLIHEACFMGDLAAIQSLITSGAHTDVLDGNMMTPLQVFAVIPQHPSLDQASQIIDFLVFQHQHNPQTLLSYLNTREGSYGFSALHFAVANNHHQIVAKLLSIGANPTLTDNYGRNAFDLILNLPQAEQRSMLEVMEPYLPVPIAPINNPVETQTDILNQENTTQTLETEVQDEELQTDLSIHNIAEMEEEIKSTAILQNSLKLEQKHKKQQAETIEGLEQKLRHSVLELQETQRKSSSQAAALKDREEQLKKFQKENQSKISDIEAELEIAKSISSNLSSKSAALTKQIEELQQQLSSSAQQEEIALRRLEAQKSMVINLVSQGIFEIAQHIIKIDPTPEELLKVKNATGFNLLQICSSIKPADLREEATKFILEILPETELHRQSMEPNSFGLKTADMCINPDGNIVLLRELLKRKIIDPNTRSSVEGQTHRSLLEIAVTNKSSMNLEAAAAFIEFGADIKQQSPAYQRIHRKEGTISDLIKANNNGRTPEIIQNAVRTSIQKRLGLSTPDSTSITEQQVEQTTTKESKAANL